MLRSQLSAIAAARQSMAEKKKKLEREVDVMRNEIEIVLKEQSETE